MAEPPTLPGYCWVCCATGVIAVTIWRRDPDGVRFKVTEDRPCPSCRPAVAVTGAG